MTKFIINLGLFVFLILSIGLIVSYFGMLMYKMENPDLKNLSLEGFVILGVPIALFVVADFFILRRFFRSIKGEVDGLKKELRTK